MDQGNQLFPVFFRLDQFEILIIGGGYVALEKLTAIFLNSPNAIVTVVAIDFIEEILNFAKIHSQIKLITKKYDSTDLESKSLVIAATTIRSLNIEVASTAKTKNILINVADTPELCDFYLSSIVKKGDLKIAISTNGKSPTFAKRIRELLEEVIPDNIDAILDNLKQIQKKLKGDFDYKVKRMNEITTIIKNQNEENK